MMAAIKALLFVACLSSIALAIEPAQEEMISVIVPSFQRSAFLLFTLQEILLQQTYKNVEVIAIDDSPQCLSLHALRAILPNEADRSKVHYLCKNDRRYSVGEKRNMAVKESKGEYLAFWDETDAYPRFRLEKQLAELKARNVDMVALMFSHVLSVNDTGSFLFEVTNPGHFGAHFGTLMLRRAVVDSEHAVKFPDTSLAEDYAIVERALAMGYKFSTQVLPWAYTRIGADAARREFSVERVGGALSRVQGTPSWLAQETVDFFGAARDLVAAQAVSEQKHVVNRYPSEDVAKQVTRKLKGRTHTTESSNSVTTDTSSVTTVSSVTSDDDDDTTTSELDSTVTVTTSVDNDDDDSSSESSFSSSRYVYQGGYGYYVDVESTILQYYGGYAPGK